MEWYGEKMLPRGLPGLVYQITPSEILNDLKVISLNKRRKKGLAGQVGYHDNYWIIQLYPTIILRRGFGGRLGTQSFCYWLEFLKTLLHEIGHIMTNEMVSEACKQRYECDSESHNYIENLADSWRDQAIEKIASRDPRLGQPSGWIGGLPGIYILRRGRIRDNNYGKFESIRMKDIRAQRCGGQHGIDDIAQMVWRSPSPITKQRIYRTIKQVAFNMNITRAYFDSADRKHLFFNNGEAIAVSAEVRKAVSPKRWVKEEVKREEESDLQDLRGFMKASKRWEHSITDKSY